MTIIARAWGDIAPKLWAFLAGGLTPTILVTAVAWAVYTFTGGRLVFELDATLAALLTTVIATVAGWFKRDRQLAGLGWSEMSPKLLTLVVSSGLVTVLVAIASQLGFELPAWAAGLLAAVLPMISGYLKADTLNLDHAPLQGHHVLVAGDLSVRAHSTEPRHRYRLSTRWRGQRPTPDLPVADLSVIIRKCPSSRR